MTINRHIPERTCCGCFARKKQDELLAVTRLMDGSVLLNVSHKLSGRSAYLCRNKTCMEKARLRKGKDGLSFGLKTHVPREIWAELEKLIIKN